MSSTISDGIVYGPVQSRRLGMSLGLNILPVGIKVCAFNCNYCHLGWTYDLADDATIAKLKWPDAEDVAAALEEALKAPAGKIDTITISGNGEPTLHPDFYMVVRAIMEVRDRVAPHLKVQCLSNGANLGRPQVVSGLNLLDERHIKLDAGSEALFLEMNNPTADIGIWDIMQHVKKLTDHVVQAMFTRGRRDNTRENDVAQWIDAVKKMGPKSVHVYTISREAADAAVKAVDGATLRSIGDLCRKATGIPVEVF